MIKLDWKGVAIIAGTAFIIYLMTRRDVQKIAQAVNPANPENIVYKTVSAGTETGSFGSALYDVFGSGSNYNPNA
jgi:hypothetical protein